MGKKSKNSKKKIQRKSRQQRRKKNIDDDEEFSQTIEACNTCTDVHILRSISEMPSWCCTHNRIIFAGYRPITLSSWQTIRSLFLIHNETGNIWTHMGGAIMFYFLFQHVCRNPPDTRSMSRVDFFYLCVFFFGVFVCLFQSTLYHLFSSHSLKLNKLFAKLDYCGITILIGCSFIPWIHYGFYNSPLLQIWYISFTIICTIICVMFCIYDPFCNPRYHHYRTLMFMAHGFLVFVPAIHWISREMNNDRSLLSLDHRAHLLIFIQGITFLTGSLIYIFKLPESIYPNITIFSLWFNSHQLFHILVIFGLVIYYHSLILIMKMRLNNPNCFVN
ncbi:adiponectin receptor protein-like [Dermatophagoides pteronyssinus]|uniref:adiponectin receptor protein-like n=1 Tax=Dermatophagoides pteronyssinus TaxID=6956 RepID=UPI003F66A6A3